MESILEDMNDGLKRKGRLEGGGEGGILERH
jgi:hypothetical protein